MRGSKIQEWLIRRIEVNSVLTKSNPPVSDCSANPYAGCTHACKENHVI